MSKGKYLKQKPPATKFVIGLAIVLFWLVVLTTYMTSGLFAKYVSRGMGKDQARVITFGDLTLTETGDFYEDNKLMMIVPGVDLTKEAVVSFGGSESATYVFVEAVLSERWQKQADNTTFKILSGDKELMAWSVAGGWTWLKSDGSTHIYYRELAPNTPWTGNIITDNKITVSEWITKFDLLDDGVDETEIESLANTRISFRAAVVQSGGFADAGAAWASLAAKEGSGV